MRTKQALQIRNDLALTIRQVYANTQHFALAHEEHLADMTYLVWEKAKSFSVPQWVRSYLYGVADTLSAQLYEGKQPPLVWVLFGPDGTPFGPGNDNWLLQDAEYKSAMTGKHCWRHMWEKNKIKPY